MTTPLAIFLLVNAAWSFLVWPAFLRRVSKDSRAHTTSGGPTRFLVVHQVLVTVSLALATGLLILGVIGLVQAQ